MKNYTNEELCHLINQPCNNTAKAEYFKRIKFADDCLPHKVVLHVPTKKYVDGILVDVNYDRFVEVMLQGLEVKGYYAAHVVGSYDGRLYPEKQVTVFVDEAKAERVDYVFKHAIVACHEEMQQEAYAYELDGKMYVVRFDDDKKKEGKKAMTKAITMLMIIKEELEKHNAYANINLFVCAAVLETLFAGVKPDLSYLEIKKGYDNTAINLLPELMEEVAWNAVNKLICNKFYGNYKLNDFAKATRIAAARLGKDDVDIRDRVLKELSVIETREKVILE